MEQEFKGIPRLLPLLKMLRVYHRHRVVGIENISRTGGVLLITNHSFATYDALLLGEVVYEKHHRLVRALGDSLIFKTPVLKPIAESVGIVDANPHVGEQLLKDGQILGIAPGGMHEAIRSSENKYKIDWAGRKGFVRLAVRTQCPIVLAACPRSDDIFSVQSGWFSELVYQNFKLPLVLPLGFGRLPFPKPVQLTHLVAKPLFPPKVDPDSPDFERVVDKWHLSLVRKMEKLMAQALHL